MSLILGIIDRTGNDSTERTIQELKSGSPTVADGYGIATKESCIPRIISKDVLHGSASLGYKLVKIEELDNDQPMIQGSTALTFIGRLWDNDKPPFQAFSDALNENPEVCARSLYKSNFSFSAATLSGESYTIYRDPLGMIPLYYGINANFIAVSSNTKILRQLELNPTRVKPGYVTKLSVNGFQEQEIHRFSKLKEEDFSEDDVVSLLDHYLSDSMYRRVKGHASPTIAFSGGIDSTLLAYYALKAGVKPRLECVGVDGSTDFQASLDAADALGLRVNQHLLSLSDLESLIPKVIESVEEIDPMKIGVALPLYVVAKNAQSHGSRLVLSGNGCDELFGGYSKYLKSGIDPREEMYSDLENSYKVNFERDWKTCSDFGVELRLPYTDRNLIEFSLKLPLRYKLSHESGERKIILRRLAKRIGFSESISNKPKRAAQYSSGVSKALNTLAKRRKLSTSEYLQSLGSDFIIE